MAKALWGSPSTAIIFHIHEKLAWLAMHAQLVEAMSRAGVENPDIYPDIGLATPGQMYTNIAKYLFADDQHEQSKVLADIAGGIATTIFSYKDWKNPEEKPFIEKYLADRMVYRPNTGSRPSD